MQVFSRIFPSKIQLIYNAFSLQSQKEISFLLASTFWPTENRQMILPELTKHFPCIYSLPPVFVKRFIANV